ncbi:MAG: hypothetical protein PHC63_07020 [Candidatus Bathyarchaeota archaeon]|nr:hypothetical protein [Candidatus Bathyarchaeota archaeon]
MSNSLPDKDARLFLKQLLEANSVVIDPELISEKVSAIHIEEVLKCVKKWLKQKKQTLENDMVSTSELAKVGLIDDLIAELAI